MSYLQQEKYMSRSAAPDLSHSPAFNLNWLKSEMESCIWGELEIPGTVDSLEILNSWDTDKYMIVMYQAKITPRDGDPVSQLYVGNLVVDDQLHDKYIAIEKRSDIQPAAGKAVTLIPEANLILVAYPNDMNMRLMSEEMLKYSLDEFLPKITKGALDNLKWQIIDVKMKILRYVPNKRFTTLCHVTVDAEEEGFKEFRFIAKQLKSRRKANELHNNLFMLPKIWKENLAELDLATLSEDSFELPVRIPRPLALDEENRIVYFEELEGKNLLNALHEIDIRTIIPAIGKLLANFHCACRPTRKIVTFESELAEMEDAIQKVSKKQPRLRIRLNRIYREMAGEMPENDYFLSLLHGTFRLNHIFVHNNDLALLDMDSVRMGHPAYDVANFLSSLYYLEAQNRITSLQRYDVSLQFIASYANHSNWPVSPKVVLWFLTSLLIHKQVYKYLKHLHEDREVKTNRILTLAEEVLDLYYNLPQDMQLMELWRVLPGN